eukprot:XP_019923454.1 PREDICTED: uncharacterized protein LOC105329795 isoform X2 [Crassostrea gigas]
MTRFGLILKEIILFVLFRATPVNGGKGLKETPMAPKRNCVDSDVNNTTLKRSSSGVLAIPFNLSDLDDAVFISDDEQDESHVPASQKKTPQKKTMSN